MSVNLLKSDIWDEDEFHENVKALSLIEIEAQHFIQNSLKNRNVEEEIKSREEDNSFWLFLLVSIVLLAK